MHVFVDKINPVLLTDCYNLCHQDFKINTDWEVSHIYNRNAPMILYGLNKIIANVFDNMRITTDHILEAERYANEMNLWFPSKLFYRIVDDLDGYMPVKIQAIADGNWIPRGTPFCQIRNTVVGFGECVTWWEAMLMHAWFPSACATEAFHMRKYLDSKKLSANRFHSFGFRGHRSLEDAYWAGTAWNLFLPGTDDLYTKKYTTAYISSIPALAHKVVEQFDNELECYLRAIDQTAIHGKKYVSLVIDTFDTDNFIENYAEKISNYAASKDITPVFRPDSGDKLNQVVSILRKCDKWNPIFIIGDEMNFEKAKEYDRFLEAQNIQLQNMNYGIGGGFYSHLTRETLGWAMKTAYSNGKNRMKFSENKQSIPGKVKVVKDHQGQVSVFPENMNTQGYLLMYVNVYYHNKDPAAHCCITDMWSTIQNRALGYLNVGELQKEIILSNQIQDEIDCIRENMV
ncbi:MAG: nicotinamide phosphoribosyltransferase domain-containing protein [Nitrososphaeraceae archaeon]